MQDPTLAQLDAMLTPRGQPTPTEQRNADARDRYLEQKARRQTY